MLDGSYPVSDIRDYFEYIIKKHDTVADIPSIQIYTNKIKNRVAFKIKTGYKLELLLKEMMILLGSTVKVVAKDKNSENVPKVEMQDVVLMHCNVVTVIGLLRFASNKQFGQLITISPYLLTMLKTTNTEFSIIELSFADQNNRPLEIEDNVNDSDRLD